MAIDSGKEKQEAPKTSVMWTCPSCGKTAHISRRFCDCHAALRRASVKRSAGLPDVGPCNFEAPGLCCNDCPGGCARCASFVEPRMNSDGYGGEECKNKAGTERCSCCQFQIKARRRMATFDFSAYMNEIRERNKAANREENNEEGKNLFARAADVIYEEITQQILARINREREWAV